MSFLYGMYRWICCWRFFNLTWLSLCYTRQCNLAWANSYFLTDEWLNSLIHHTRMGIHGLKKWWLHKSIRISWQEYQQNNFSPIWLHITPADFQLMSADVIWSQIGRLYAEQNCRLKLFCWYSCRKTKHCTNLPFF